VSREPKVVVTAAVLRGAARAVALRAVMVVVAVVVGGAMGETILVAGNPRLSLSAPRVVQKVRPRSPLFLLRSMKKFLT